MLLLWKEDISYWKVALGYALVGIGVGFAGTPASHSLTGSVPVKRAGMASGTADLQRDLGGAIMQSIFGALLTAGYAAAAARGDRRIASTERQRQRPDAAHEVVRRAPSDIAQQYPQYATRSPPAAKTSFLQGDQWAYLAGIVAVLLGAALVFFVFPGKQQESAPRDLPHRRRCGPCRIAAEPVYTGFRGPVAQLVEQDSVQGRRFQNPPGPWRSLANARQVTTIACRMTPAWDSRSHRT